MTLIKTKQHRRTTATAVKNAIRANKFDGLRQHHHTNTISSLAMASN